MNTHYSVNEGTCREKGDIKSHNHKEKNIMISKKVVVVIKISPNIRPRIREFLFTGMSILPKLRKCEL